MFARFEKSMFHITTATATPMAMPSRWRGNDTSGFVNEADHMTSVPNVTSPIHAMSTPRCTCERRPPLAVLICLLTFFRLPAEDDAIHPPLVRHMLRSESVGLMESGAL